VRVRWGTAAPRNRYGPAPRTTRPHSHLTRRRSSGKLAATPDMRFEFHPFDATPRVAIFDGRGLQRHLPLVAAACPKHSAGRVSLTTQRCAQPYRSIRCSRPQSWEEQPERLSARGLSTRNCFREAGIQGRVVVEFVLDTSGRAEPLSLKVIETPNPGSIHQPWTYVRRAVYRPARVHGRAVRVLMRIPVEFKLSSK